MFEDIFIIRHTGECIYHLGLNPMSKKTDESPHAQLFSGFLSAIMTFYEHMNGGSSSLPKNHVNDIKMDYLFIKQSHLYILNTPENYIAIVQEELVNGTKLKKSFIEELLKKIYEKFKYNIKNDIFEESQIQIIKNKDFDKFIKTEVAATMRKSLFTFGK